jgi:multiple sugar transport system permease protein
MSTRQKLFAFVLLAPCIGVLLLLVGYPYSQLVYMSTSEGGQFTPSIFQGALTDPYFLGAVKISIIFTAVSVAGTTLLGLGMAFLLDVGWRGERLLRTIFLIPLMAPTVVSAVAWKILLSPAFGLINYWLSLLGIPPVAFFGDPNTALWSVLLVNIWINFPFALLVFAAALKAFPTEPFEAARLDGASPLRVFRHITIPFLRPILLLVVIFRTVWSFQEFEEIYILTGGGPGTSTLNLYVLSFFYSFVWFHMDTGAAIILCMFLIVAVVSGIYILFLRRAALR